MLKGEDSKKLQAQVWNEVLDSLRGEVPELDGVLRPRT